LTEFPDTRESLLVQIRSHADRAAWEQFAQLYRPVIYRLARRRGLQDADAQDLVQQVLLAVASTIGTWEKSAPSVRFRHWLRRVTRNAIVNALTRRPLDLGSGNSTVQMLLQEHPDGGHASPDDTAEIEQEYRRELYRQAARIVRQDVEAETWRAFELTVIDNQSIADAALAVGKSAGTVYAARSRIMRRLREAIQELENAES